MGGRAVCSGAVGFAAAPTATFLHHTRPARASAEASSPEKMAAARVWHPCVKSRLASAAALDLISMESPLDR